jgi:hypothetical protein
MDRMQTEDPSMTQGGALELSGSVATLLLLAPFVALAIVVWRALREDEKAGPEVATSPALGIATFPAVPEEVPVDEDIIATPIRGKDGELAELYLRKARDAVSAGDVSGATGLLRQSIGYAQQAGNASIHADARLDLADIAREAGDLTTACEHWQIARKLFIDTSCKDRLAEADALMLRHGCPTDWVLTDF